VTRRHYVLDFDSLEDWVSFMSGVRANGWWEATRIAIADAHPNLRMLGQAVMTNAIA